MLEADIFEAERLDEDLREAELLGSDMKFISHGGRLRRLSRDLEVVDPELTTDGIALRDTPDEQFHQLAIGAGFELAICPLPRLGGLQLIALVKRRRTEHIPNDEMRAARALQVCIWVCPVRGAEILVRIGLDGTKRKNSRVTISGTRKRASRGIELSRSHKPQRRKQPNGNRGGRDRKSSA
jgi:hypothetical protein